MTDLSNIQNLGGSFDPLADAEKEEEGESIAAPSTWSWPPRTRRPR